MQILKLDNPSVWNPWIIYFFHFFFSLIFLFKYNFSVFYPNLNRIFTVLASALHEEKKNIFLIKQWKSSSNKKNLKTKHLKKF